MWPLASHFTHSNANFLIWNMVITIPTPEDCDEHDGKPQHIVGAQGQAVTHSLLRKSMLYIPIRVKKKKTSVFTLILSPGGL